MFYPCSGHHQRRGTLSLVSIASRVLQTATALIALFGAAVFIIAPTNPLGGDSFKLLTYSTLREHDQLLENQIAAVKDNFKPDNTLLLAGNWRFFQFYLPDYKFTRFALGAKYEVDAGTGQRC